MRGIRYRARGVATEERGGDLKQKWSFVFGVGGNTKYLGVNLSDFPSDVFERVYIYIYREREREMQVQSHQSCPRPSVPVADPSQILALAE